MRLTLLDGAAREDQAAASVRAALHGYASSNGWKLTSFFLPDMDIAPCAGDFKCWIERPGICAIGGANQDIARAMVQSELAVFLTPITFGGYSYHLKKAVDHLIPNISPLFRMVNGEVHHKGRYKRYPAFLAVGTERAADEGAERVFGKLVERNAINMRAPACEVVFAVDGQAAAEIALRVHRALAQAAGASV